MTIRRGPLSAVVALLTVVGLVAIMVGTKPTGRALAAPTQASSPPADPATGEPIAALVDDYGAAILLPGKNGAAVLAGVHRDGGSSWRLPLSSGAMPLGCTRCPDIVFSTKEAGLYRVANGKQSPMPLGALHLNDAIGLPGLAPVQQSTALATDDANDSLVVDLLSAPSSARLVPGRGPRLPLTRFQQAHAVIAMSTDGRSAAAIATAGVLDPGRWRLLVVRDGSMILDQVVTAFVTDPESAPNATACLANDGSETAFVLPARNGAVAYLHRSTGVAEIKLPSAVAVLACDLGTRLTVAVYDAHNRLLLRSFDPRSSRAIGSAVFDGNVGAVQFCPGTGRAVLQNDAGTVVSVPGGKTQRIPSTSLSGCTETGTPWFIGNRRVSWLKAQ